MAGGRQDARLLILLTAAAGATTALAALLWHLRRHVPKQKQGVDNRRRGGHDEEDISQAFDEMSRLIDEGRCLSTDADADGNVLALRAQLHRLEEKVRRWLWRIGGRHPEVVAGSTLTQLFHTPCVFPAAGLACASGGDGGRLPEGPAPAPAGVSPPRPPARLPCFNPKDTSHIDEPASSTD